MEMQDLFDTQILLYLGRRMRSLGYRQQLGLEFRS